MKILILGNSNNTWVASYVKNVLHNYFSEIYVSQSSEILQNFKEIYDKCNVKLIKTDNKLTLFNKITIRSEIFRFIRTINEIRKIDHIDYIHLHYVSRTFVLVSKFVKKKTSRTIATFWGSDLLRHEQSYFSLYKNILNSFDYITVSTYEMKEDLRKKIPSIDQNKVKVVRFGISCLKTIDQVEKKYSSMTCKKAIGIKEDKFVIAVGYNRSKSQNHIKVIEALGTINRKVKDKIVILLQLSYGPDDKEYFNEIINSLKECRLEYKVITEYYDEYKSAILRLAVDYFINSQNTDGFSATMQEYLYSGAYVINSSKLNYQILDDLNEQIINFNNFKEITQYFNNAKLRYSQVNTYTREIIRNLSSWDCNTNLWRQLYE